MTTLKQLRQHVITARQALTAPQCLAAATKISTQLFNLAIFQKSEKIACYLSFKNEVNTRNIVEKIWQLEKSCYLPIITQDKNLRYAPYRQTTLLKKNKYSLLEPKFGNHLIEASSLDLIITPLVAFDESGTRIGWGHGHYDRCFHFLQNKVRPDKPYLLGIAYELQKQNHLTRESWDIPLDAIITESTIYYPQEK